ncbi:MAG: hypothetical protein ACJAYU_001694 [Bradymonadia bacterium]|jgi:hypothetical protein
MNRSSKLLFLCAASIIVACGDEVTEITGDALLSSAAEPAGDNCELGGTALSVGVDKDGSLAGSEVESTTYLCDGATGSISGIIVLADDEPSCDNCKGGGLALTTGIDADADGALTGDEVIDISYVCQNALTEVSDESPGDNCEFGGVRVDAGSDANDDGSLGEDEVTVT